MAAGGDITEITWNHPTLGSGVILPKGSEDSTYDPGGIRSNDDAASIDGGGNSIDQMNRVRWSFEVAIAWEFLTGDTLADMAALAASPVPADWTFTNINGVVYRGKGKPVGDLQGNGNAATMPLKVSGGGLFQKL